MAGKVNGKANTVAIVVVFGQILNRLAHRPAVHLVDQPKAFCRRHETARHNVITLLGMHTQQDFIVHDLIFMQAHDGLVGEFETIPVNGVPNAIGPADILRHTGFFKIAGLVHVDTVTALGLGNITGQVRL